MKTLQLFARRVYARTGTLLVIALLAGGCASSRPPTAEMASSKKAVEQAAQVGAREYAPAELRTAEKKLEEAEAAVKDKDHDKAQRLAEQAIVDAELAQITALSSKSQEAVRALRESIQALRDEINRNKSQ